MPPGSVRESRSRWLSRGWMVCSAKPPTPVTSAGRSSWPTSGDWRTTSTVTRRDVPARRARRCGVASGRCDVRPLRPAHGLRYTGPDGDYPVYCCRSDRDQRGAGLCQEVRALPIDALVERVLFDALAPGSNCDRARGHGAVGGREPAARNGNGRCAVNVPATRPNEHAASMMRSNPKTASWRDRSNAPGRRSCAPSRRSTRSMHAGGRRNRSCCTKQIAPGYRRSAKTCRKSGARRPHHPPIESASCNSSFVLPAFPGSRRFQPHVASVWRFWQA